MYNVDIWNTVHISATPLSMQRLRKNAVDSIMMFKVSNIDHWQGCVILCLNMVTIKAYGSIFVADVKRSATGTPKTICPSFYEKAIMIICQTGFDFYWMSTSLVFMSISLVYAHT